MLKRGALLAGVPCYGQHDETKEGLPKASPLCHVSQGACEEPESMAALAPSLRQHPFYQSFPQGILQDMNP